MAWCGRFIRSDTSDPELPEEYFVWLNVPTEEAPKLQRPRPVDMLQIVADGSKSDKPDYDALEDLAAS